MDIGSKIKQLRNKRGLTQEELANRCNLSKGFISQVERDLTSPSIATLADIAESLGISLKDFFGDLENDLIKFGKEDIFVQENDELQNDIAWLIPTAQKNAMEPILITIKPFGKSELYPPFNGEVFGYVISGYITLYLGENEYKLKKNESFYYKANHTYYVENRSKTNGKLLWVTCPPNF